MLLVELLGAAVRSDHTGFGGLHWGINKRKLTKNKIDRFK
jgi:hypothetical protein